MLRIVFKIYFILTISLIAQRPLRAQPAESTLVHEDRVHRLLQSRRPLNFGWHQLIDEYLKQPPESGWRKELLEWAQTNSKVSGRAQRGWEFFEDYKTSLIEAYDVSEVESLWVLDFPRALQRSVQRLERIRRQQNGFRPVNPNRAEQLAFTEIQNRYPAVSNEEIQGSRSDSALGREAHREFVRLRSRIETFLEEPKLSAISDKKLIDQYVAETIQRIQKLREANFRMIAQDGAKAGLQVVSVREDKTNSPSEHTYQSGPQLQLIGNLFSLLNAPLLGRHTFFTRGSNQMDSRAVVLEANELRLSSGKNKNYEIKYRDAEGNEFSEIISAEDLFIFVRGRWQIAGRSKVERRIFQEAIARELRYLWAEDLLRNASAENISIDRFVHFIQNAKPDYSVRDRMTGIIENWALAEVQSKDPLIGIHLWGQKQHPDFWTRAEIENYEMYRAPLLEFDDETQNDRTLVNGKPRSRPPFGIRHLQRAIKWPLGFSAMGASLVGAATYMHREPIIEVWNSPPVTAAREVIASELSEVVQDLSENFESFRLSFGQESDPQILGLDQPNTTNLFALEINPYSEGSPYYTFRSTDASLLAGFWATGQYDLSPIDENVLISREEEEIKLEPLNGSRVSVFKMSSEIPHRASFSLPLREGLALSRIEIKNQNGNMIDENRIRAFRSRSNPSIVRIEVEGVNKISSFEASFVLSGLSNPIPLSEISIPIETLEEEIKLFRDLGFLLLAANLESEIYFAKRSGSQNINIDQLARIFKDSSIYLLSPRSQFPKYYSTKDFSYSTLQRYQQAGVLCGQCDEGNFFFNEFLNRSFKANNLPFIARMATGFQNGSSDDVSKLSQNEKHAINLIFATGETAETKTPAQIDATPKVTDEPPVLESIERAMQLGMPIDRIAELFKPILLDFLQNPILSKEGAERTGGEKALKWLGKNAPELLGTNGLSLISEYGHLDIFYLGEYFDYLSKKSPEALYSAARRWTLNLTGSPPLEDHPEYLNEGSFNLGANIIEKYFPEKFDEIFKEAILKDKEGFTLRFAQYWGFDSFDPEKQKLLALIAKRLVEKKMTYEDKIKHGFLKTETLQAIPDLQTYLNRIVYDPDQDVEDRLSALKLLAEAGNSDQTLQLIEALNLSEMEMNASEYDLLFESLALVKPTPNSGFEVLIKDYFESILREVKRDPRYFPFSSHLESLIAAATAHPYPQLETQLLSLLKMADSSANTKHLNENFGSILRGLRQTPFKNWESIKRTLEKVASRMIAGDIKSYTDSFEAFVELHTQMPSAEARNLFKATAILMFYEGEREAAEKVTAALYESWNEEALDLSGVDTAIRALRNPLSPNLSGAISEFQNLISLEKIKTEIQGKSIDLLETEIESVSADYRKEAAAFLLAGYKKTKDTEKMIVLIRRLEPYFQKEPDLYLEVLWHLRNEEFKVVAAEILERNNALEFSFDEDLIATYLLRLYRVDPQGPTNLFLENVSRYESKLGLFMRFVPNLENSPLLPFLFDENDIFIGDPSRRQNALGRLFAEMQLEALASQLIGIEMTKPGTIQRALNSDRSLPGTALEAMEGDTIDLETQRSLDQGFTHGIEIPSHVQKPTAPKPEVPHYRQQAALNRRLEQIEDNPRPASDAEIERRLQALEKIKTQLSAVYKTLATSKDRMRRSGERTLPHQKLYRLASILKAYDLGELDFSELSKIASTEFSFELEHESEIDAFVKHASDSINSLLARGREVFLQSNRTSKYSFLENAEYMAAIDDSTRSLKANNWAPRPENCLHLLKKFSATSL